MRRCCSERGFSSIRLILGLALLAAGVLLTLDSLDLADADDYFIYWPIVLVAIGLSLLPRWRAPDLVCGGSLIVLGAWLLLFNLGWVDRWPLDYFWPLVLIALGAFLTLGGLRRRATSDDPASHVFAFAFWSGIERSSSSEDFRGADLTAIMGGVDLDLRQARIRDRAEVRAFTLWGGIDLRVPPDWHIEYKLLPILGAYGDETDQRPGPDSPTLVISGAAIMAGIDIKN